MKKICTILLCIFLAVTANAQSSYASVKLEKKSDYKNAEKTVLQASNFLLTTKYDKDDPDRLYAVQFIMNWMEGTPDHVFQIDEKFAKPFTGEPDILGLYMAAMAKIALENKTGTSKDANTLPLNAVKMVLRYGANPAYNFKLNGELKKMYVAFRKNELEKYFGLSNRKGS